MKRIFMPVCAATGFLSAVYAQTEQPTFLSQTESALRAFNPAVSVIIDTLYYADSSEEGMSHIKEEMPGFGGHHHGDHDHGHGYDDGFNLREVEVQISAEVDGYF